MSAQQQWEGLFALVAGVALKMATVEGRAFHSLAGVWVDADERKTNVEFYGGAYADMAPSIELGPREWEYVERQRAGDETWADEHLAEIKRLRAEAEERAVERQKHAEADLDRRREEKDRAEYNRLRPKFEGGAL